MFLGLIGRRGVFFALLCAAIGIPYLWNQPQWRPWMQQQWRSLWGSAEHGIASWTASTRVDAPPPIENPTAAPAYGSLSQLKELPDMLSGPPTTDFGEVFRFDITPRWVLSRWSRVTTVLAEHDLEGLRVPFVSGTKLDDIAGSLTYYFDKQHRLQRISFEGQTGDERRLVNFIQHNFHLELEPSHYAALLLAKWNGKPTSVLWIQHAPVVVSAEPYARYQIQLELNRPDHGYRLSDDLQQQLDLGRKSWRWGT